MRGKVNSWKVVGGKGPTLRHQAAIRESVYKVEPKALGVYKVSVAVRTGSEMMKMTSPDFSPRLDAFRGLPGGRGFSPAEIVAPALCWSHAPRSPSTDGLRGAWDAGIIRTAL